MAKKKKKKDKGLLADIKNSPGADNFQFLNELISDIDEEDGAQLLGSDGLAIKIRGIISSGCPGIDAAIGRGGYPLARLTILHGKEASGKTTLALHAVAECQREGGVVIYIDKEYKLDPDYARSLGVNIEQLMIVQPRYLEGVFTIIETAIDKASMYREKTGKRIPILIVFDSMNAAITKAEYLGTNEDKHMAACARVFSALLPKLIPKAAKEDVCLLFISQIREKIGITFGDKDEVSGGNAPKFYASLIVKIKKIKTLTKAADNEKEKQKIGSRVKIEIVKNQIAPPFRKTICDIEYGKGIDKEASLLDLAESLGIVEKSGVWFSYKGEKLGQGKKAAAALRKDPEIYDEILGEVRDEKKW